MERRTGGLRGISPVPGVPHEPPADLEMGTERMVFVRGHDTRIAQELAAPILNGPTTEAAPFECRHIAVKLRVAHRPADWSPEVEHHLGVHVHCRERLPVGIPPTTKTCARRVDHHQSKPGFGPVMDRGAGVARHRTIYPNDEVSETPKVSPRRCPFSGSRPQRATHRADDALLRRLVEI